MVKFFKTLSFIDIEITTKPSYTDYANQTSPNNKNNFVHRKLKQEIVSFQCLISLNSTFLVHLKVKSVSIAKLFLQCSI